jgi:hypothetical protein
MRSYKEYCEILELWEKGYNKLQITKQTGIPRATVRDCINRYGNLEALEQDHELKTRPLDTSNWSVQQREAYAYLLAAYLGDGYISKGPRTYQMRIALDSKYPGIIDKCCETINILLPENKVGIVSVKLSNGIEVSCYSNKLPELFPQIGPGTKHTRPIILEPWQQQIADEYPIEFLRGFIHTDGCRFDPVINETVYSRYQFSNLSEDIMGLFIATCDKLGISCTRYKRNLTIAKRKDVAYLDSVIGQKV